jgi:hypothetical protein
MDHAGQNLFEALRDLAHIEAGSNAALVNTPTDATITKCRDEDGFDDATFCMARQRRERRNVPGHHWCKTTPCSPPAKLAQRTRRPNARVVNCATASGKAQI